MKIFLLTIGAVVALPSVASAEYYIIQRPDKTCEVVETVPENTVQLGPLSFTTRDEAEREVEVVCDDGTVVEERSDGETTVIIERQE